MSVFGLSIAALIVLLPPAVAAVAAAGCRRGAGCDPAEMVAVGYGAIGVSCVALWLASSWIGMTSAVLVLAPTAAAVAVAAAGRPGATGSSTAGPPPIAVAVPPLPLILGTVGAVFALLVFLPFLSYGLELADGVHRMAMTDWYKHLVVTTSLEAADRFPPPNPFLHPMESAPYYYGFHLLAAALARTAAAIGGAESVYPALILLTLLTAAATPFVAFTVARSVCAATLSAPGTAGTAAASNPGTRVPLAAAVGATMLAGFDLVPWFLDAVANVLTVSPPPAGFDGLRALIPSVSPDYWIHHNERQFNAPYMSTMWAPQHMAAVLVALVLVHLVLRRAAPPSDPGAGGSRRGEWVLPAVLIAALPALSAYVALALAVGVGGSIAAEWLRARGSLQATFGGRVWLLPGAAGAALALPVLLLLGRSAEHGLVLHVSSAGRWTNGAVLSSVFGGGALISLLDTAALYLIELGVIGLFAAVEIVRRARRGDLGPAGSHIVGIVVAIVVLVTFVRPPIGGPNNLYARPMLLVWFLLAPFAAMGWERRGGARRKIAMFGVALCFGATGLALAGMVAEGRLFGASPRDAVDAVRWVNANSPRAALLIVHPDDFGGFVGYWSRRRLVLADRRHALLFGATGAEFDGAEARLREAYASTDARQAASRFEPFGDGLILVRSGRGGLSAWGDSECFAAVYSNDEWVVVERRAPACRPSPPAP